MTRSLVVIAILAACSGAWADVTLPNNLQENSVASATKVMGNFNALAAEVNSQDARITIVEQSVGGGTISRTFTFSGFVEGMRTDTQDPENDLNIMGINDANAKCREAFGSNYGVVDLLVLAEALKYHVPITYPSDSCGVVITGYMTGTSAVWWGLLSPTHGNRVNNVFCNNQAALMCGFWD